MTRAELTAKAAQLRAAGESAHAAEMLRFRDAKFSWRATK
jgi:hypothetical protein